MARNFALTRFLLRRAISSGMTHTTKPLVSRLKRIWPIRASEAPVQARPASSVRALRFVVTPILSPSSARAPPIAVPSVFLDSPFLKEVGLSRPISFKRIFQRRKRQHREVLARCFVPSSSFLLFDALASQRISLGSSVRRFHLAATLRTKRFSGMATCIGRCMKEACWRTS